MKAMQKGAGSPDRQFEGPIDLLIVSPKKTEPYFIYFRKAQMSKEGSFATVKKFVKEYSVGDRKWVYTWNKHRAQDTAARKARKGGKRNGGAGRAHACERRRSEARRPAPPAARATCRQHDQWSLTGKERPPARAMPAETVAARKRGASQKQSSHARAAGRPHRPAKPAPPAEPP